MAIGVVGYTIRSHTHTRAQVERAYAKLSAMGYDGVENPLGSRLMPPEEELAMLKHYNLKMADIWADIADPDEAMKKAEQYGVKIIGINAVPNHMMTSSDGFYAYAELVNEQAKPFHGTGYKLQYHNHSEEFRNFPNLGGKAGMAILIEECDPDVVVFELDTHWMAAAGCDPAQWIRKVKGRIPVVHFKDIAMDHIFVSHGGGGMVPRRFAEIGQGNINWPNVRDACVEAGVQWHCVEQDFTVMDPFDSLKMSIDYMRRIGVK